jgi:hypothetical protein
VMPSPQEHPDDADGEDDDAGGGDDHLVGHADLLGALILVPSRQRVDLPNTPDKSGELRAAEQRCARAGAHRATDRRC